MIHCDKVSKRFGGGQSALSNVSFRVDKSEMTFVTGHSGAGKSTLLKLIAMIQRPSGGRIVLGGLDLGTVKERGIPWIRRRMGFVFQDHQLLNDRNIFDNVALPLLVHGMERKEIGRRVRAALDTVGLLNKEKARPITLSTGEQQRVGIARAIVHRPPVVLADEPTGNLDPALSMEIMQLFQRFNSIGTTTLIATHDLALVKALGKRVLVLDHGRLGGDLSAMP